VIRNIDGANPSLNGDSDHLDEEFGVRASAILGGELYIFGEGAGKADRFGGPVKGLLAVGGLDVFAFAAGERGDSSATDLAGDGLDGGEVAIRGDGKSGLENIDAEARNLVGQAEFLLVVHGTAG
jgi:hypothetical protein